MIFKLRKSLVNKPPELLDKLIENMKNQLNYLIRSICPAALPFFR